MQESNNKETSQIENPNENPHSYGKQLIGLAIGIIIFGILSSGILAIPGIMVFSDAWSAGIYKKRGANSFPNFSPMGWGLGAMILTIVVYPLYTSNREKLKTKPGNPSFYTLVHISCIITIIIETLAVLYVVFFAQ